MSCSRRAAVRRAPTAATSSRPRRSGCSSTAAANWPTVKTLRRCWGNSSRMKLRCVASAVSTRSASARSGPVRRRLAKPDEVSSASVATMTSSIAWLSKPWVPALENSTPEPGPESLRAVSSRKGERQMLAVQTNSTLSGSGIGAPQVEVAGLVERDQDVVERVLDGAAGGVDAHGGVDGLLVGRGDAGELGDLTGAGLGVEALAVAALALLERRGDVDEEERAPGGLDHLLHLLAGLGERSDRRAHRDAAVAGDLRGHPADAPDIGLAVGLAEGQSRGQVASYDVAVEAGHRAPALLEQQVHQRAGERRLAAPGQAGEEEHEALLLGLRLVGVDDRGDGGGEVSRRARRGGVRQGVDRVTAGVGLDHLGAEGVVGVGVA